MNSIYAGRYLCFDCGSKSIELLDEGKYVCNHCGKEW